MIHPSRRSSPQQCFSALPGGPEVFPGQTRYAVPPPWSALSQQEITAYSVTHQ